MPTEEVVEVRRGRKVQAERKFFPGYVLVKMEMTDAAYHLIKNTPKVTGFLGADNKAIPITEDEAMRILHQVKEGVERPKPIGHLRDRRAGAGGRRSVRLLRAGTSRRWTRARSRSRSAVSIFGRPTPVELEFGQVEKVA